MEEKTPKCLKMCESGYSVSYKQDKHFGASAHGFESVEQIQTEIMTNGPVEGSMRVYSDFLQYKTGKLRNNTPQGYHYCVSSHVGVYRHTTGSMLGGHAIRVLGWGVEDGTDYWIVANSWNTDWGDAGMLIVLLSLVLLKLVLLCVCVLGFFKIVRGRDEVGIESGIVAGMPKKYMPQA